LAGLIVDAADWKAFYNQFEDFRRQSYQKFGADFGEFKGSEIFMHQGGAYKLQLKPDDVQWVYDNLVTLIFDSNVSRIIVAQSKAAFIAHRPAKETKALTKDLRLRTWETFLVTFEQFLLDKSLANGRRVTGLVYFDGPRDKHVAEIVNRYARKYNQEQPFAGAGIVESPIFVDSKASRLIQLTDVLAYSTNYIYRTDNSIESFVRIHKKVVERILEEVKHPLK
jgi:hypothetical protein